MNKGLGIGILIVIIILGIVGIASFNFEASNNSLVEDVIEEEVVLEIEDVIEVEIVPAVKEVVEEEVVLEIEDVIEVEIVPANEDVVEEEEKGRKIVVELVESVGIKSQ